MNIISEGVKGICENLVTKHNDWVQGTFEYINTKHPDLKIWNCNGIPLIRIGSMDGFNVFEKIKINNAIKKSMALRLKEK